MLLWISGNDSLAKKLAFGIVCSVVAWVTLRRWPLERAALRYYEYVPLYVAGVAWLLLRRYLSKVDEV